MSDARHTKGTLICVVGLLAMALAYALWPPLGRPDGISDKVVVQKSARTLKLLRKGEVLETYRVSLGHDPRGPKTQTGDHRTPEGNYVLDWRNPHSRFYLSLHVSYPNAKDTADAAAKGTEPGGDIMIHGLQNGLGWIGRFHRWMDWTDGCIAVTDAEMDQIWRAVPDGTPIEIRP